MGKFTFISGDDEYLVQQRGRAIFESWASEDSEDEFSREVLDGRAGNMEELGQALKNFQASVQTLSLFGSRKRIWFKDITFLGDNVTGRAKGTQELLDSLLRPTLESLDGDTVKVVLSAFPVDRRRSIYKWLQSKGDSEHIAGGGDRDPSAYYPIIEKQCESAGVDITPEARDMLIERVSANGRLIRLEIEKLIGYVGNSGETINADMVNQLVPHFGEAQFFEAAEAFYTLNLEAALEALRRHFYTNKEARGLIGNLQTKNRLLIQLRVLLDAGTLTPRINANQLSRASAAFSDLFSGVEEKSAYNVFSQNPYYLSRLSRAASQLPLKRLIDFQENFLNAFEQCLERHQEQETVLRETYIRCLK